MINANRKEFSENVLFQLNSEKRAKVGGSWAAGWSSKRRKRTGERGAQETRAWRGHASGGQAEVTLAARSGPAGRSPRYLGDS